VILDAVIGTGRARPIEMPLQAMLRTVRQAVDDLVSEGRRAPEVLALDLPTGMNADTGHMDPSGLAPDLILTLGRPKVGLFVTPSATTWRTLDIGIPDGLDANLPIELMTEELIAGLMPDRSARSNKGTYGRALIVAGSESYVGAAYLACAAAGRSGAGLVTLATPDSVFPLIAGRLAECTYLPLVERTRGELDSGFAAVQVTSAAQQATAMLIGPGLGQAPQTVEFAQAVVLDRREGPRLVLDADCLNALRDVEDWPSRVRGPSVLTPHPGELARLLNVTVPDIEHDRLQAALTAADRWNHVVALKGACTVIAHPDGRARISRWVNPGLATGGTGDVLAGMVAAFLAQGLSPFDAASVGVHVHGMAGEAARERLGEVAMVAGDLLEDLPGAFRELAGTVGG
jgi:NAD(P)H-hydrate epimerase